MTNSAHFGEQIHQARLARGWTLRTLAEMVGVSEGRIRQWERGYQKFADGHTVAAVPSEVNAHRVATALGGRAELVDGEWHFVPAGNAPRTKRQEASQDADTVDVMEAIRRDTSLLPEAREHLLNQYQLLLRVAATEPKQVRALSPVKQPTPVAEQDRDGLDLPAVARKRPAPRKRRT